MYCANCGCQVEDDMGFCPECGEKLALPGQEEAVEEEAALTSVVLPEQSVKKEKLTLQMVVKVFDQRVDRWFQTKRGRVVWRGLVGVTALSVAIMVGKAGLFYKNYGWLYQHDFSADTISALQQEVQSGTKHAENAEKELEQSKTRYEYLASYDISTDWKSAVKKQITELNVENQLIVQQVKAVVMREMGYTYTPTYNQRQYENLGLNLQNGVIDELGGDFEVGGIVGSGVKAALDAASEDASLSNILEGAKKGLAEGTVGYVEDKILGDFGGTVTGILSAADSTKTKIESMGSAPPAALNEVSDLQKAYLSEMQNFVNAERITSEDMTDAYNAMCGYRNMNQVLKALAKEGEQVISPREQEMELLIEQYNKNLELLQKYIGTVEGEVR